MTTQAMIGVQRSDGAVLAIYCHYDGSPISVGHNLMEFYSHGADAKNLLDLGDLLEIRNGTPEPFSDDPATYNHVAQRYKNSRAYAEEGKRAADYVYLMYGSDKPGKETWKMLQGTGDKGNPRWPTLARVLKEAGARVPAARRPVSATAPVSGVSGGTSPNKNSSASTFAARIAIEDGDGTTQSIYCGFDGGIEEAGAILVDCYFIPEAAEELVALGDLDEIGESISGCSSHYRDMGVDWSDAAPVTHSGVPDFLTSPLAGDVARLYVYIKGEWYYCDNSQGSGRLSPLEDALEPVEDAQ